MEDGVFDNKNMQYGGTKQKSGYILVDIAIFSMFLYEFILYM